MREIGRTKPLSAAEVRAWKADPDSATPEGTAILAAAAVARAQNEHRRERREFEDEHRELQIRAEVERRLLSGARIIQDPEAKFIASDLAFEAMKWLVRLDGDAEQLSELDRAALRWAGVSPTDRDTWFIKRGPGRRRDSPPPKQPAKFVRDTESRVWVTQPILRSRGWTDAGIRDFLPEPDGFKQNPYYSTAAHPMPAWLPETVAEAEASQRWQQWLQRSLRRRKTTLNRLVEGIDDEGFRRRIDAVQAAIDSYHRAQIQRTEPPDPNKE